MKQTILFIFCMFLLLNCSHNRESEQITYPHDQHCFTQGLELYNGYIYESCGLYGFSYLKKYKLGGEKELVKRVGEKEYFYEGLTIFQGKLYLLTWKSGIIQILDPNDFTLLETKKLPEKIKEGWGITHDDTNIYISNGTSKIYKLTSDFRITESIETGISRLNELEFHDGNIYANIWGSANIVSLNPLTGTTQKIYDFSRFSEKYTGEKVLNGITFSENGNMIITGKKWEKMYEF